MINKIIILMILVIMIPGVFATQTIPIEYDVNVDFDGDRDFRILLPYGHERHFTWDDNETHADTVYKSTLYYNLDEETWCSTPNEQLEQFKNITSGLSGVNNVCTSLLASTHNLSQDLFTELQNKANRTEQLTEDLAQCEGVLESYQRDANDLRECEDELDDEKSSGTTTLILAGGAGLAAGFFLWGRKKKNAPSEQAENESYGDMTRDEFPSDGPKQ